MFGGKCPLLPTGATNPGPRNTEFGSVMLGFEFTSRSLMVDWLMNWTVREVSGPPLLAKYAPVSAFAYAPSTANTRLLGLPVISGATPLSTRTPRMVPLRSVTTMIASELALAAAARWSRMPTSPAVSTSCATAGATPTGKAGSSRLPGLGTTTSLGFTLYRSLIPPSASNTLAPAPPNSASSPVPAMRVVSPPPPTSLFVPSPALMVAGCVTLGATITTSFPSPVLTTMSATAAGSNTPITTVPSSTWKVAPSLKTRMRSSPGVPVTARVPPASAAVAGTARSSSASHSRAIRRWAVRTNAVCMARPACTEWFPAPVSAVGATGLYRIARTSCLSRITGRILMAGATRVRMSGRGAPGSSCARRCGVMRGRTWGASGS